MFAAVEWSETHLHPDRILVARDDFGGIGGTLHSARLFAAFHQACFIRPLAGRDGIRLGCFGVANRTEAVVLESEIRLNRRAMDGGHCSPVI